MSGTSLDGVDGVLVDFSPQRPQVLGHVTTPFPDALKGKYQCFTQADLTKLRAAGYTEPFLNVEQGVSRYIAWLSANADFLASPF